MPYANAHTAASQLEANISREHYTKTLCRV